MSFIPTLSAARFVVSYALGAQAWSNVFHALKDSFVDQDMLDVMEDMDAWIGANWLSQISQDVSYTGITGYDIRTIGGSVVTEASSAGPGTAVGDALPIHTACVVTLRTATRGRSGRGRVYVSGFFDDYLADGVFTASAISDAGDYVTGLQTQMTNNNWTLCVRSIQQNGSPINPAAMRPVTGIEVRNGLPGTQRRRIDRP